jgi:hypothetical protein
MNNLYESIKFTEQHHLEIAELFDYSKVPAGELDLAIEKYNKYVTNDRSPRYLYLIRRIGTKYYKIGITNDLNKRLSTLQTGCPHELRMIFYAEADMDDYLGKEIKYIEDFLHKNFNEQRHRGEWFKFDYHHISDIVMFLDLNRELVVRILSTNELSHYFQERERFGIDAE